MVKNLLASAGDPGDVGSLGGEDPLEEGMATHSSIAARRIPWTEEPGGLPFMDHSQTRLKRLSMHAYSRQKNLLFPFYVNTVT